MDTLTLYLSSKNQKQFYGNMLKNSSQKELFLILEQKTGDCLSSIVKGH